MKRLVRNILQAFCSEVTGIGSEMPEGGQDVRDTAKICDVGVSTVQRVKKKLVEAGEVRIGR